MAENNEADPKIQASDPKGDSVVAPIQDPMSFRDTDTGNLKRLTPGKAKKTIKLKPLTAKSSATKVPTSSKPDETQQGIGSATSASDVKTATAVSQLVPNSASTTGKQTIRLKTGGAGSETSKSAILKPAGGLKPAAGKSAILTPAAQKTTSPDSPTINLTGAAKAAVAAPTPIAPKPLTPKTGLTPVPSDAPQAEEETATPAAPAAPKPLMQKAPAVASAPISPKMPSPVSPKMPETGAATPISPKMPSPVSPKMPEAAAATPASPKMPSPISPKMPETGAAATPAAPKMPSPLSPKMPSAPKMPSPVSPKMPETGAAATPAAPKMPATGLALPKNALGDEEEIKEPVVEEDQFEKELKDIKSKKKDKKKTSSKADDEEKVEPGIILSLCSWAAMLFIGLTAVLCAIQFANHWHNQKIQLPLLENIADKKFFGSSSTSAPAAPAKMKEEPKAPKTEKKK